EQDKILDLARWMMPPSRILLTSRHVDFLERLPPGSASPRVVVLGGLSRVETQRLFFEEVGRQGGVVLQLLSDAQITAIYEVTNGHPLAVRLLVAEAIPHPLEMVLAELRQTPHDVLDTLFVRSWKRLAGGARLVLQSACVLSGPASHESLAAMTGLSEEAVD